MSADNSLLLAVNQRPDCRLFLKWYVDCSIVLIIVYSPTFLTKDSAVDRDRRFQIWNQYVSNNPIVISHSCIRKTRAMPGRLLGAIFSYGDGRYGSATCSLSCWVRPIGYSCLGSRVHFQIFSVSFHFVDGHFGGMCRHWLSQFDFEYRADLTVSLVITRPLVTIRENP